MFLRPVLEHPVFKSAFRGIRIGVLGLIINAAYRMGKVIEWKKRSIILLIISLGIFIFTSSSPMILFLIGGLIGLFDYRRKEYIKVGG